MRRYLSAPGFEDPIKRQVYLSTEWIVSLMEAIDELKDTKANSERINDGTASKRSTVEGLGMDYEKIKRQILEEEST
jgi:capsid protein